MAKSTNMIGDMTTVVTNGPSATTTANAIAAGGPIQDYPGTCAAVLMALEECLNLLTTVQSVTATGDANSALILGVSGVLVGAAGPSTQVLTDMASAVANAQGLSASGTIATNVNAIAPGGPILDPVGCLSVVEKKFQQMAGTQGQLTYLHTVTAASDDNTNRGKLADLLLVLV